MKTKTKWPKGAWMRLRSADTLRALMRQDSFSLARLARYAGCSKGFISHLLSGRRTSCSKELAERIAEALSVPTEILFATMMPPVARQNNKNQEAA